MGAQQWWRDAVVYQIYPRSFRDSDRDGEGDLAGILERLEHLSDLGVDALWLSPFYPSPMKDSGYDVSDYYAVDPRFGTMADFDALLAEATRLGIRVLIDIVPNHCSDRHELFQQALAAPADSPERDLFIFRDHPNNWPSFFGGSAWTQVSDGQYYLHLFDSSQPDWNWRNPKVPAMFEQILRFWLDKGVAGFRVDVGNALYKKAGLPDLAPAVGTGVGSAAQGQHGTPYQDQPELDEHYRSWRAVMDSYGTEGFPGQRVMVGETWADDPSITARWINAGMTQSFDFRLIGKTWEATAWRSAIAGAYTGDVPVGASPWAIGNHDVPRIATRLGLLNAHQVLDLQHEMMKAPDIEVDTELGLQRARAAALLVFSLPGSCYVYQGDELGLPEYLDIPADRREDPVFVRTEGALLGRDGCRVPLPWRGEHPSYDFSPDLGAVNRDTWLPQPDDWADLSVTVQTNATGSTLELYRAAIATRRRLSGDIDLLTSDQVPEGVLSYRRGADFCCITNFGFEPVRLPAELHDARILLASTEVTDNLLPANSTAWLSI